MTKRWVLGCLALLATAGVGATTRALAGDSFVLYTEDYPPLSYVKDGQAVGSNVEVVKELFRRASLPVQIKVAAWDQGFDAAKKEEQTGIFAATRTPEREASFRWIGPISSTRWVFLAKKSRGLKLRVLEDAFKYKIGGYKDDAKTLFIRRQGGTVDTVERDQDNVKRLESGAIDLWVTGYVSGPWHAKNAGVTDFEQVLAFHEDSGYLTLNKNTSNGTILALTRIIDLMKSEGKLGLIFTN